MESIPTEFPISLQSWPSKEKDPNTALPNLIKRINLERGGFRNLTEDGLRQEIAEAEAEEEEEDTSSDEEEEEKPDQFKELMNARDEMLQQLEEAHRGAVTALDFVSLLLSKDQPNLGGSTLSPFLREAVGTGTLGADKIAVSKHTQPQVKEDRAIAKGWKTQNLNKSVDSILASATRLEKEIEVETKYWEQVLAINEHGWAICRLPQEKHTLGVRIGFLEAAPAFRNNSLAALRREEDGTISLDQGIASTEPQTLRVRIQSNNEDIGTSIIRAPIPDNAAIESRILQARNTMFSSELWQELNREARTLASFGVRSTDDTITCPLSPSKIIILDLVPLSDAVDPSGRPGDQVAEGIFLTLSLLLTYQHRQNHRRRTQPPPPITVQKRPTPAYNLLRPLITRLDHQRAVTAIHTLLQPLCSVLNSAGISPPPNYTITTSPITHTSTTLSPTESIILSMVDRLESIATLNLLPNVTITITSRTAMFPVAGTIYMLHLGPEDCPLLQSFRAPNNLDIWAKVEDYVLFATGVALASSFAPSSTPITPPPGELEKDETNEGWQNTVQPYILRKRFREKGKSKQLSFQVLKSSIGASRVGGDKEDGELLTVKVRWEWIGDAAARKDRKVGQGEGTYEWTEKIGGKKGDKSEGGEGEVVKSLKDVIEEAAKE